jgi:hypothetical protein
MGECEMYAAFRVLPGHSMGAESVMLEAGARNTEEGMTPFVK